MPAAFNKEDCCIFLTIAVVDNLGTPGVFGIHEEQTSPMPHWGEMGSEGAWTERNAID